MGYTKGADPEFFNRRGPKCMKEHSDRAESEYDLVLTSTSMSNCILTVHTHNRILDLYNMNFLLA